MIIGADADIPRSIDQLMPPELAARLDRLDLLSRKILAGRLPGERRSKRRGRSVEFDDFREYAAGDDLRHVDWNVYARLDRLFIKLFREEEDLGLHLLIDVSASMDAGPPSKLVFAHRLAMALAYIGLVNHNRVSVSVFGGGAVAPLAPLRGRRNLQRVGAYLMDSLAGSRERRRAVGDADGAGGAGRAEERTTEAALASESAGFDFAEGLKRAAARSPARGLMVVLSDFLARAGWGAGLDALGALAGGGATDVYCLQVLTPGELDPGHESAARLIGDLRLEDAELAPHADVTISSALVARYRRVLEEHNARLRGECLARGLAYFLIPSDTAVDALVLGALRKGGMLR